MNRDRERELTVSCGQPGEDGRRLTSVMRDGREFVERMRLEGPYERVCFDGRAFRHFGMELTAERLAELDLRLVRAPREAAGPSAPLGERPIVRLSGFKRRPLEWLWPGRIARKAITLVVGDPGLGKSLVTLDIAARVSRGMDWPDGETSRGEPASVVLLSGEGDMEVTIRPRLEALGADCERIVTIGAQKDAFSGDEAPPFELERDFGELARTVERLGDCALVVLDPISAFLGRTGECSNSDIRRLLLPLSDLARRKRLAVLMVSHLRKDMGVAVRQALGSIAFVAVSRAAWLVSRDADHDRRRLMLPVKNNLAADVDGLAFMVEARGEEGHAAVKWSTERIKSRTDEAFSASRRPAGRPDAERREAMEWLRDYLSKGPRGATEVRETGEANGFTFSTLRRAFRSLGGVAVKGRDGWLDGWQWKLPAAKAEAASDSEANGERVGAPQDTIGGVLEGLLPSAAGITHDGEQLSAALQKASAESAAMIEAILAETAEENRVREGG